MQKNESINLPEYLDCPAFLVVDSVITQVNDAAEDLNIPLGGSVLSLIRSGLHEYEAYRSGKLYLQLEVAGTCYPTSVVYYHGAQLFCLHTPSNSQEFRALAVAAAQLRAPLQGAFSAIEQLKNSDGIESNSEVKHLISGINQNLYQLLRNVGNMSDAESYPEFRKRTFERLDMQAVFASIAAKLQDRLSPLDRKLRFSGLSKPVDVEIDPQSIERAICNLVSNAIKFSPIHSTIRVSAKHSNDRIYISVENSCYDYEFATNQLFEQYLRIPGMDDPRQGIGLGLPVVRNIAIGHGGTLLVDRSGPGLIRFTMSIAVRSDYNTTLYSGLMPRIDYTGGFDTAAIELSDIPIANLD